MGVWEGKCLSHRAKLSPAITGEFHRSGPEHEFFISRRQTGGLVIIVIGHFVLADHCPVLERLKTLLKSPARPTQCH